MDNQSNIPVRKTNRLAFVSLVKIILFFICVFVLILLSGTIGATLGDKIPMGIHVCWIAFAFTTLPVEALVGSFIAVMGNRFLKRNITNFQIVFVLVILAFLSNALIVDLEGCF